MVAVGLRLVGNALTISLRREGSYHGSGLQTLEVWSTAVGMAGVNGAASTTSPSNSGLHQCDTAVEELTHLRRKTYPSECIKQLSLELLLV